MADTPLLDREEYIEQTYLFRTFRERVQENLPAQEVLERLHEEILATTRLPFAIQFLATELKHTGELASGFARLSHYFTPFQTFVVGQSEQEGRRFSLATALLVLERQATYLAGSPSPAGLFVYHFETLSRNRLGYADGLTAMAGDPMYDADWRAFLDQVRHHIGTYDFADMVFVRSEMYVTDQRRQDPGYVPAMRPLFGEKEGKIARANRGRDPLFLFGALQRQLNYPEVPRPRPKDDAQSKLDALQTKLREMEARLRLVEGELRGQVDLSQFGKPDLLEGKEGI
ncbi:MAG TPA: hypothetical protein VH120_17540 [Gemmataceae bacterium]|nr:hypothetical protein [Gemmataceae bacterium]